LPSSARGRPRRAVRRSRDGAPHGRRGTPRGGTIRPRSGEVPGVALEQRGQALDSAPSLARERWRSASRPRAASSCCSSPRAGRGGRRTPRAGRRATGRPGATPARRPQARPPASRSRRAACPAVRPVADPGLVREHPLPEGGMLVNEHPQLDVLELRLELVVAFGLRAWRWSEPSCRLISAVRSFSRTRFCSVASSLRSAADLRSLNLAIPAASSSRTRRSSGGRRPGSRSVPG